MNNNQTFIIIPSCGIGHYINNLGNEIIIQNILTQTDTKIRCDEGASLFLKRNNLHDIIITCGGIYLPKERQTQPAADLMKKYLVTRYGIQENSIWCENKSLDSWQNVELAIQLIIERGVNLENVQLLFISHWTHVLRLMFVAWTNGYKWRNIKGEFLFYPIGCKEVVKQLFILTYTLKDPRGISKRVAEERERRKQKNL